MHFCQSQRDCPICREEVIGVRRNHTMAKIVNVYVRLNPSMERSASEKATCDLLNVINDNIVSRLLFEYYRRKQSLLSMRFFRTFQEMDRLEQWLFEIIDI